MSTTQVFIRRTLRHIRLRILYHRYEVYLKALARELGKKVPPAPRLSMSRVRAFVKVATERRPQQVPNRDLGVVHETMKDFCFELPDLDYFLRVLSRGRRPFHCERIDNLARDTPEHALAKILESDLLSLDPIFAYRDVWPTELDESFAPLAFLLPSVILTLTNGWFVSPAGLGVCADHFSHICWKINPAIRLQDRKASRKVSVDMDGYRELRSLFHQQMTNTYLNQSNSEEARELIANSHMLPYSEIEEAGSPMIKQIDEIVHARGSPDSTLLEDLNTGPPELGSMSTDELLKRLTALIQLACATEWQESFERILENVVRRLVAICDADSGLVRPLEQSRIASHMFRMAWSRAVCWTSEKEDELELNVLESKLATC